MSTLATCFKLVSVGFLVAWANMSFAHALHDDAHSPHHHSTDRVVGRDVQHYSQKRPQHSAHDKHEQARSLQAQIDVDQLIARYSVTGDDHLIEQGWRAIEADLSNPTPRAWMQAAWLAQAEHRFDLARIYLERVLKVQPRNPQAWLLEASVAMVQADVPAARRACAQVAITLSPVVALACQLRAEQEPARRVVLLERVRKLPLDGLEDSVAAWVLSIVGDAHFYAREFEAALTSHIRSYALNPSVQARAALADTLIALERFSAAKVLLDKHRAIPALGVRYLLAIKSAGVDSVEESMRLDTRFKKWIAQNDFRHAREMAMFYLDIVPRPQLAHRLALENLRYQKEQEDVTILQRAATALAATTRDDTSQAM